MSAHRGDCVARPEPRLAAFEPEQPVRERPPPPQVAAHRRLHQAEVFADHERAGAAALVGEYREQGGGRVAHVRALCRVHAVGDPEKSEEPHHVVEPHPRRMRSGAANGIDEGFPPCGAQLPWVEGGKAPVLAIAEELVGRRADAHARRQEVLPAPRVKAVRGEAHRDVGDKADLF